MCAADLGRRLLNECVETRLDKVLRTLRSISGQEIHQDETLSTLDRLLSVNYPLHRGQQPRYPALEISAEDTGAGRSQLVYYIISKAILPDSHGSSDLKGKKGTVILFDADARFDVERLVQIMHSYMKHVSATGSSGTDAQEVVEQSLQHLHVFQPRSMASLLDGLNGLLGYLYDFSVHHSSERPVHSIVIDSASAFYWETLANLENERVAALNAKASGVSTAAKSPSQPNPYALLVNRLRSIQQTLSCAIIATTTASAFKESASGEQILRTLPTPWPSFPTAKLLLKRDRVEKFGLGMSWEDAEKEKSLRQTAVELGYFSAKVVGSNEYFRFTVTRDGVQILNNE
ncbi:uncharacterized protein PV09_01564 [Verruconis gallopava]|uniref:DNA recombination and repair protein Rad51-like C-terminal domain-containing protein n=1 Tax=Verruconis gallopava TaxID=253628 RepID=A0A0D2B8N6_9PEZI|nr:uncharacterized protein PV09_01564 [Verruconis gallopava]KIW07614.1 hypothetical protein PV09_01564 [Verruconis gallopava]